LGSAGNMVDLPIPPQYKLDSNTNGFVEQFGLLAADVMGDFPAHFTAFDPYRKWLQNEPRIFKEQIAAYFLQSNKGTNTQS
jgi:hypothetical protein